MSKPTLLPLRLVRRVQKSGFRLTDHENGVLRQLCGVTGKLQLKLYDLDNEQIYQQVKAILTGGRVAIIDETIGLKIGREYIVEIEKVWPRQKGERV